MRIRTCLRHAVAVASVLAAVSAPMTSAHAQAKPKTVREELPENLRGDWEQGLTLSKDGKFELARVKFMQVYEQSKNPRVLFNAGVMEKNLGRFAAADLLHVGFESAALRGQVTLERFRPIARL